MLVIARRRGQRMVIGGDMEMISADAALEQLEPPAPPVAASGE